MALNITYPDSINVGSFISLRWSNTFGDTYFTINRQINNNLNWVGTNYPVNSNLTRYGEQMEATWERVRYRITGMPSGAVSTTGWITVVGGVDPDPGGGDPPDPPPATPTLTVPTQVEHGETFTVSWQTYLIGTTFEVGRSVNGGSYSTLSTAQTGGSYTDTALSSWTSVKYRVRAKKDNETSSYGYSIEIPVVVPLPKPTVPTISMPSSITANTGFTLSWSGGNGGTFYIDRSINGGAYSVLLENASNTSRTETPSSSWTSVKYRIRAFLNSQYSGYAYTNTISVKAQTPTVSTSPRIMHRNTYEVNWSSATTGAKYTVDRSVNGGSYTRLFTDTTTTSITESPLDTWTSVRYAVIANHGGANSSWGYSSNMAVDPFFPKLKVMQGGSVKTGIAGWVLVGGVLKRVKDIWIMTGGVLKKLS